MLSALKSRQARIALCDELALQHEAGGSSQVIGKTIFKGAPALQVGTS